MIFKRVGDLRPYPDHGYVQKQWAAIAPHQVVILPIAAHKGGVMEKCEEVYSALKQAGIRVKLDDRDHLSPGWKFNEWELKGVPLRLSMRVEQATTENMDRLKRVLGQNRGDSDVYLTLVDGEQELQFMLAPEMRVDKTPSLIGSLKANFWGDIL